MDFLSYLQSSREDYPRISIRPPPPSQCDGRHRDASADKKILEICDRGDDGNHLAAARSF